MTDPKELQATKEGEFGQVARYRKQSIAEASPDLEGFGSQPYRVQGRWPVSPGHAVETEGAWGTLGNQYRELFSFRLQDVGVLQNVDAGWELFGCTGLYENDQRKQTKKEGRK